jgi:hypothetical protein
MHFTNRYFNEAKISTESKENKSNITSKNNKNIINKNKQIYDHIY